MRNGNIEVCLTPEWIEWEQKFIVLLRYRTIYKFIMLVCSYVIMVNNCLLVNYGDLSKFLSFFWLISLMLCDD